MVLSLKVRGVNNNQYKTNEFIILLFYIPGKKYKDKILVLAYIKYKLYLIDKLRVNILISNNIIRSVDIVINIS